MSVNLIEFNDDWNNFLCSFLMDSHTFLHCLDDLMGAICCNQRMILMRAKKNSVGAN